jgi:hypothetical protein
MRTNDIKYAVEQRLRLIDFLVAHYGTLRREAIVDYFGISTPQASLDIRQYMELAPSNLAYDKHSKCYRRADDFKRVWS